MKRLIKQKEDEKEAIEEARNGTKGGRGGSQGLTTDNQPPPPQGYNFDT